MPCPFRRALFGEQAIVGGIKQIVIVEQGVVPGEDRRDIGVKFIFRQLGQGDKIRQRLVNGWRRRCCSRAASAAAGRSGWIRASG